MFDTYFTICTEQECNKVCGPPGRRGQDTSEPSLGPDVQRPVQPAAGLGSVSGSFSAAGPVRAAAPPPPQGLARLAVREDARNQTAADEDKHQAAVILAEVC